MVRYLNGTIRQKVDELAALKEENLSWKIRYESHEDSREATVRPLRDRAAKADDELFGRTEGLPGRLRAYQPAGGTGSRKRAVA